MFEGGAVVEMGAVGCSNGRGCRIGAGGCSNGRGWVPTGRRLSKRGRLGFERALVVEKAPVGFQKGAGGFLGGDRWCRRGSRDGGGGGDADVAADVVEVHEDGGGATLTWQPTRERWMTMRSSVTWHVVGLRIDGEGGVGGRSGLQLTWGHPFTSPARCPARCPGRCRRIHCRCRRIRRSRPKRLAWARVSIRGKGRTRYLPGVTQ